MTRQSSPLRARNPVRRFIAQAAAAAVLVATAGVASGQPSKVQSEDDKQPAVQEGVKPPTRSVLPNSGAPYLTIQFPGGTVRQYLETLRKTAGEENVNVVIPEAAADCKVPSISLRNVAVETAVQAIQYVSEGDWNIRLIKPLSEPGVPPVYAVNYFPPGPPKIPGGSQPAKMRQDGEPRLQVYSIRDLIEAPTGRKGAVLDSETVLSAVQEALELSSGPDREPVELRYHQDAKLLLVRGLPSDLALVAETLSEIGEDLRKRQIPDQAEANRQREADEVNAQLMAVQLDREMAVMKLGALREEADRAKELRDQGLQPESELLRAVTEARAAEVQVKQVEVKLNFLQRRLDALNAARPGGAADGPISLASLGAAGGERVFMEVSAAVDAMNKAAGKAVVELRPNQDQRTVHPAGEPEFVNAVRRLLLLRGGSETPAAPAPEPKQEAGGR